MKENEKEKNVQVNRFNATGLMCSPHSKYWHISLHLVDFSQLEHSLRDDRSRLVRVCMTEGLTRWKIK